MLVHTLDVRVRVVTWTSHAGAGLHEKVGRATLDVAPRNKLHQNIVERDARGDVDHGDANSLAEETLTAVCAGDVHVNARATWSVLPACACVGDVCLNCVDKPQRRQAEPDQPAGRATQSRCRARRGGWAWP